MTQAHPICETLPPDAEDAPRPTRIAFKHVGCKLNAYEVEALKDQFHRTGYEVVPFAASADVFLINTCTVTGSGDADSRKLVRRARRLNPDATVVATGCYAQRRPGDLLETGASIVVGNDEKAQLVELVRAHLGATESTRSVALEQSGHFLSISGLVEQGRTRGTLQIQDGCSEHCTYCVIPSVRGKGVSRPLNETVEQARLMVDAGYRELALTGVHSGSYGLDRGEEEGIVQLLVELEKIPGLDRLRLNSVEPCFVTDELIDFAANSPSLCRHFHIPLQSGDDAILRRMGRNYTGAYFAERVERIARRIPDCAIGTDVMVGFPGEEQENFASTHNLLADLPISYLHVFPYSLRPDTPAAKLKVRTTEKAKRERKVRLLEVSKQKSRAFNRRFLDRSLSVLVEDRKDKSTNLQIGLSDNYIKVLLEEAQRPNQIVNATVTQAREDLVLGRVVP